jgi:hypothetical protein
MSWLDASLTHGGKHGTSLSDNRILNDRNGSLGRQAERVAQSATDRRNLIWVMPAQGANKRFIDLGCWHNTSASLFLCASHARPNLLDALTYRHCTVLAIWRANDGNITARGA